MSLIDQAERKTGPQKKAEEGDGTRKLMQSTDLLRIAGEVIERNQIPPKSRKLWSDHRKRLHDVYWPLGSLLGKATERNFANIVAASLEHFLKMCEHVQPNGEWKIFDYEVGIRTGPDNEERIAIATQYVDAVNATDLHYHNGQPAVNVNVTAPALPKEIVDALTQKHSGTDDELKDLIKQFVAAATNQAATNQAAPAPEQPAEQAIEDQA